MIVVVESWETFKDWLSKTVHLTHHQLHLLLGVLLLLIVGRLLRRPLGSWSPLLLVSALELVNELLDFTRYRVADWPWTPRETLIDIAITLAPPLVVVLVARLWSRRRRTRPSTI